MLENGYENQQIDKKEQKIGISVSSTSPTPE